MSNIQTFTGDGTTTSFYFTFSFFGVNDVQVSVGGIPQTADDIAIYPTQTSGDAPDVPYTGGRVDFVTPPANGAVIKIWRDIELARHIDYQPTAQPQSHQLNQDINQCIEILKELSDTLTNAISIATVPTLSNLLSEMTTIQNTLGTFATTDALAALGATVGGHTDSISTLNTTVGGHTISINTLNGYDYVIEAQEPAAGNNYTWYRKYKSGWVEMGGAYDKASFTLSDGSTLDVTGITFPVTLSVAPTVVSVANDMTFFNLHVIERTTTGIKLKISNQLGVPYTQADCHIFWTASGKIAE